MQIILNTNLAEVIRKETGENVFLCYQCQKCSAGCPVVKHFDLLPNQVMRAIQFGQKRNHSSFENYLALCHMRDLCDSLSL